MPNRTKVEVRTYSCRTCGDTFSADHLPLEPDSGKNLLEVTDLRAWHWLREDVATLFELEAS